MSGQMVAWQILQLVKSLPFYTHDCHKSRLKPSTVAGYPIGFRAEILSPNQA